MIDLHTHIAPGIDDGADDTEQSLEMIRIAFENGTREMVLTPHFLHPRSAYIKTKEKLIEFEKQYIDALSSHFPDMKFYTGAEHFCDTSFFRVLDENGIIPINDTRYVLVEFSVESHFSFIFDAVREILSKGYLPIIAHAERYASFHRDPDRILILKRRGCVIQVNSSSALEQLGSAAKMAGFLLRERLADVIASDAHGIVYRSPNLSDAAASLSAAYSNKYIEKLLNDNPKLIIENKSLM